MSNGVATLGGARVAAHALLGQEARGLLTRIAQLRPFALNMPMVTAAAVTPHAQAAIESHMSVARRHLYAIVNRFVRWLDEGAGRRATPAEIQRRFTLLRLRFNAVISQFDMFSDVLAQRSEHSMGVWIAGLDAVAADGLALPGYYESPPVMCYLDRGHGAAIRRARTRLPGGDLTPVAIIRVPRERMVGSGLASSLIHEVGHQAAALLDLVHSLRPVLHGMQRTPGRQRLAWQMWERWISEIVADFWSIAKVGYVATLGLLAVVSLPRVFVFATGAEDPHPMPWLRVKLGCAMGQGLFPDPQWQRLAHLWECLYPCKGLNPQQRELLAVIEDTLPSFVSLLINHRPRSLRGASLREALATDARQPARLRQHFRDWGAQPQLMRSAPPTLAFAAIGQVRADGALTPEDEAKLLESLLAFWATRDAINTSAACAAHMRRLRMTSAA